MAVRIFPAAIFIDVYSFIPSNKTCFYILIKHILNSIFLFLALSVFGQDSTGIKPIPANPTIQATRTIPKAPVSDTIVPAAPTTQASDTARKNQVIAPAPSVSILLKRDSAAWYFHAKERFRFYPASDTLLDGIEVFDPIFQEGFYGHTGNLGAPHTALAYRSRFYEGFAVGYNQYDLYIRDIDSVRYYNTLKPFSRTHYAQTHQQQDAMVHAEFGHQVSPGLNLGLEYRRINHEGIYGFQKNRHTTFALTSHYRTRNNRYELLCAYAGNTIKTQNNGGLTSDTMWIDTFSRRVFNPQIFLTEARTINTHRHVSVSQYLNIDKFFSNKKDSTGFRKNLFTLSHHAAFRNDKYKYFDIAPAGDSLFYQNFQTNNVGIRHFLRVNTLRNEFYLEAQRQSKNKKGNIRPVGMLRVGLMHKVHFINQEPLNKTINNLFLKAKFEGIIANTFFVKGKGHLGLWDNAGDFLVDATLGVKIAKIGQLEAGFKNQLFSPSLLQQEMYISQIPIWQNSFNKTNETSLWGKLTIPRTHSAFAVRNFLLANLIYYDEEVSVRQSDQLTNLLQVEAQQDFNLKPFYIKNHIFWQIQNNNLLRLPALTGKHSFYFENYIFKKAMLFRVGFNLYWNSTYFAKGYHPLIGQFHLQEQQNIQAYPAADAFLSFKVRGFRAYFKCDNVSDYITQTPYYLVPLYPMREAIFRVGISWEYDN